MSQKSDNIVPSLEANSASNRGGETPVNESNFEALLEMEESFGSLKVSHFYSDSDSDDSVLDSSGEEPDEEEFIAIMKRGHVRHIVTPRRCNHQRNYIKCACMSLYKVDKNKFYFDHTLLDDLVAINMELRLRQFTKSPTFDAGDYHHRHVVTVMALTTRDKNLLCCPEYGRGKFLANLYELREHYGHNEDYGHKKEAIVEEYEAQGFPELLTRAMDIVKQASSKACDKASEILNFVFEKILGVLSSVFGLISETFAKIIDCFFVRLRRMILKCFDPVKYLTENMSNGAYGTLFIIICIVIVFVVIEMIGLLAFSFVPMLVDKLCLYFSKEESYEAEAPSDPLSGMIAVTALILGLTKYDFSVVAKKAREFTSLISAGIGGSWMLSSLFLVLPLTVQSALTMKFSSEEDKQKMIIDDWLVKATAVTRLKKIPKVLVSEEYYKWVVELINDAQGLRTKIKSPVVCNIFVRMLVSLMEVLAMLENYNREKSYRDYPYSLHLCAPPGFGKTLISSKIIRDLFELPEREVYTRPVSDEFWSGFIDQKVIFYDEFLIGSNEQKEKHALEYLEIVSTKCFKPNMPSVDDPSVGIKGTRCEPVAVVTMNNSQYAKANGVPASAIWRRRRFVIDAKINPQFNNLMNGHNFDLKRLSQDQLKNVDWLKFDLLSNEPNIGQPVNNMSYNDLVTLLRRDIAEHRVMCERIRRGFHDAEIVEASPQELLDNTLRELKGVPNEPKNLTDAIFDLFVDSKESMRGFMKFAAEGPGEEEGASKSQIMDERAAEVQRKPSQNSQERKIWNHVKNFMTKKKSKESVVRRIEQAIEMYHILPDSDDGGVLEDRRRLISMLNYESSRFDMITPDFVTSDDKYESCDSESSFPIQKDIISDVAHSNVDPRKIHRHRCMGLRKERVVDKNGNVMTNAFGKEVTQITSCIRNFAHKHDPQVHGFLCDECVRLGAEVSYIPLHGGPYAQRDDNLMPEFYDSNYVGEPEGYKERMEKLWMDVLLDKYTSYGKIPVVIVDMTESFDDYGLPGGVYLRSCTAKEFGKYVIKYTSVWIGVYVVICGISNLLKNKGEKEICFAQSPKPNRQSTTSRSRRNYTKAYAQSGNQLTFEIEGKVYNAIPIKGQTFLTYYHSILNNVGEVVPDGTDMTVNWLGKSDKVSFNISMTQACVSDDILFITFRSKKLASFPNIVKKFWSNEDMDGFCSTSATVDIAGNPRYVTVAKAKNKNYSYLNRKFDMAECLMYRYPTVKGDCGSPVTSVGQHFPGKIMGMHVAGGSKDGEKFGLAVIVTREDIEDAMSENVSMDTDAVFTSEGPNIEGPNLRCMVDVPYCEQIHIPRMSKLKKSKISEYLPWNSLKHMPIMSASDPRSGGIDPLLKALDVAVSVSHDDSGIDKDLLHSCAASVLKNYRDKLVWPLGKRRLTFEEALQGVPGKLAALRLKSSPGYPLCKISNKPGKRSFFSFGANGELWYDLQFRLMVEEYVEKFESEGIDERRFVAYLKDELVSDSKVKKNKTRVIYSGDVISNVAYRMVFGSVLAAINASFINTSSAIGMNQFSHDMHSIYDYLTEVGFNMVAGDIDEWDKHQMEICLKEGYWVFSELCEGLSTEVGIQSFVKQQCYSPAQVLDKLVYFMITYYSGLFLTTIMNNITHEMYIRYIFAKKCPSLVFDEHARAKVGGDDHIYCFSDKAAPFLTPFSIRDGYKELGHTYTSDIKDEELRDEFRRFDEITFLGAHPILIEGKYCGALKKKTIEEMLHWTRNKDKTLLEEAKMALELSSVWGGKYYNQRVAEVNAALREVMEEPLVMPDVLEMSRVVANRTAASGDGFPDGFFAQGPPANSLAKLNEHKIVDGKRLNDPQKDRLAGKAVNEAAMNVNFGTDSRVFRGQFNWSTTDVPGTAIFSVDVPFGILSLGDADNVQNMGFDRFVYWKGDIELSFQINGTPFQQGLLCAYFVPLAAYEVELANITTCSHVKIQPDQSSTYTLTIPYIYLRSVMNTIARTTESLGTLYVAPLSALATNSDTDFVTLTVYSSFPESKFTIPRPLMAESGRNKFYSVDGDTRVKEMLSFDGPFEAQGNSSSTSINNTFNNIAGEMPIQDLAVTANSEAAQSLSADVAIPMPLDNPPLSSGAIPVEQLFSGMASSHGIRPTTDLQLKPSTLARQQMDIFNPSETKIESLLGHQTLLTKLTVENSMPPGTELYKITLNTRMGITEGSNIPINIAVLNQFMFWRCDVELTFVAVQTRFHSMRLQALMAYGAPGLVIGSRNVSYSSNMSFSSDDSSTNYTHTEVIPYNAQTEFLRTYEGEGVTDPIQNYALGTFGVYILNSLIAPDTVVPTVEVLVFLRFLNPKVAVPRPNSPFSWNSYLDYVQNPIYGFRARFDTDENRRTNFLNQASPVDQPYTLMTELQWTGVTPADGTYNLIVPQEFLFHFVFTDGTPTIELTRLVQTVLILGGNFYFNTSGITLASYNIATGVSYVVTGDFTFITIPTRRAIPYEDFEAQGPVEAVTTEEVHPSGTGENTDIAETITMTMEETPKRNNIPCRWEIGEKFEYTISDIHEVGRRYIRVIPVNNVDLDQFAVLTRTVGVDVTLNNLNIPVQPQNMWRGLFAAWAGGVKFRIFRNADGFLPQVMFVPYYNRVVTEPGLPIIDAMSGFDFIAYANSYTSGSSITGPLAREVLYPISGTNFIDVSAPFQSHYNFCYNSKTQDIAPISSGTLVLTYGNDDFPVIFTAFADDLRLGVFRPPQTTSFDLTVFTNGIGGFM